VVDTPPTREALDFLEAPQKLMNFLDHRVYRWLMTPARGGLKVLNLAAQPILRTIGRVIGADVLADAVDFFQAFEGIEPGFVRRAGAVQSLLKSNECRYVVVSSARRDTVDEAIYFIGQLTQRDVAVAGLVLNRLQPAFGKGSANSALTAARAARKTGDETTALLQENLAHVRRVAEAENVVIEPLLARVQGAAVARIDQRAADVHDLDTIDALGREIVG
jgi:anion-transporting  ArsA/GET3 family ATPase